MCIRDRYGVERDAGQPATDFSVHVSFEDARDEPTTLQASLDDLVKSGTVETQNCPGCQALIADQRVEYNQVCRR